MRWSTATAPTRCAGSCYRTARPSATCRGPKPGSRAAGGSSSGCGGWSRPQDDGASGEDRALDRKLHQTVAAVGQDIEALHFNKAVARIYELTSAVEKAAPSASRSEAIAGLIRLAAPMMPHLAEEAWARSGGDGPGRRRRLARGRSGAAGRGRGDRRGAGQGQAARHADRGQGPAQCRARGACARLRESPAFARWGSRCAR